MSDNESTFGPKSLEQARISESERVDMQEQARRIHQAEASGSRFLQAFRDKRTDKYHVGWIDPKNRSHDLHIIGSQKKIADLFKQNGYQKPETIPTVDFRFDPTNDALYDLDALFVNRYMPPTYLKSARSLPDATVPATIERVIRHATGDDPDVMEHFLNWLAVLFRYRERTQTAWLVHGTTGTGKGMLFTNIIRPLIGHQYCFAANLTNLVDKFNAFAEQTIVLFIDEADTDQVKSMATLLSKIKSYITEPTLPLRGIRQNTREVDNHLNLILSSNRPNAMRIEANDRRFNVCPRQEENLLREGESADDFIAQVQSELQDFADYLMSRDADRAKARQALKNDPKRNLQSVTQMPMEEVASALSSGNLGYFIDHRPSKAPTSGRGHATFEAKAVPIREVYRQVLGEALDAAADGKKHVLSHEKLFSLFRLLVGPMPETKPSLSQRLRREQLVVEPHTVNRKTDPRSCCALAV